MSAAARCDPLHFTPCQFRDASDVAHDLRIAQSSNRRPLDETAPTRQVIPIAGTTGILAPAMSAVVEIARRVWSSAWTLLVFASLFWAGNIVIGRAVAGQVPPITLAFWRWTGAVIVAVGFAWPFLKRDWPVLCRHWGILLLLSATGVASFNTMTYIGLQYTTAVNALILASAGPMIILLWVFVLFGERPSLRQMLGMMLSLLGVAIVVSHGSLATLAHLSVGAGDAWILVGIVIYALYPPLLRRRPVVHPLSLLVAVMGIGSLMMLPFYLWEIAAGATIRGGLASYAAMAYTAVLPSFIAYLFLNRAVELIGAGGAGQSSHLIPVLGMVLAVLFLGERFHLYHVLGTAAAAAGIFLASLQLERHNRPCPIKCQHGRTGGRNTNNLAAMRRTTSSSLDRKVALVAGASSSCPVMEWSGRAPARILDETVYTALSCNMKRRHRFDTSLISLIVFRNCPS